MTSLRYVGTSNWERVLVKDDGTFKGTKRYAPGDEVDDFDSDLVEKILSRPRFVRDFVEANGPEDTYGDNYGRNRYDVRGNATAYPELDMGSTVQPRQAIFVTDDENPEGFDIADPNRGPASDNELLLIKEEARQVGVKAEQEALTKRQQAAKGPTKAGQHGSGGGSATRSAEGAQKSNDGATGA